MTPSSAVLYLWRARVSTLFGRHGIVYTRMLVEMASVSGPGRPIATGGQLALLGGTPVGIPAKPHYPRFTEQARRDVDDLLREGDMVGLGRAHPWIDAAEQRDRRVARRRPLPDDVLGACVAARGPDGAADHRRCGGHHDAVQLGSLDLPDPLQQCASGVRRRGSRSEASWTQTRSARRSGRGPRRSWSPTSTASRRT